MRTHPRYPFEPEPVLLHRDQTAQELQEIIPGPIAAPFPTLAEAPQRVEEQYEVAERFAMSTSTTEKHYDINTRAPKQILLIAETVDHLIDWNRPIDSNSPKIFSSGSLSQTGKGVRRIYAKTTSGTGTLYIVVFKA